MNAHSASSSARTPKRQGGLLSSHPVLRNTYWLLGLTLLFSAACAGVGMTLGFTGVGALGFFIGAYALMYLTHRLQNSIWGLPCVFAFTGFMGMTLAPLLNAYLRVVPSGAEMVVTALGGTAAIFLGLSAYALVSGRRFSHWGASLLALGVVAMVAMVANLFLHLPALSMAVSVLFMVFSSGVILYHTAEIVHGGETNYIRATVGLYVSIYNVFVSLLQLLGLTSEE